MAKKPNVALIVGSGDEKCENCKCEAEVVIEKPGQAQRNVCKECVVGAVLDLLSKK